MEYRIAVLSDIHGNSRALKAVFDDMDRRGITRAVNLGDSLYGPLEPLETADLLTARDLPSVRGNEDLLIIKPPKSPSGASTLRQVRRQLRPEQLRWLELLEPTAVIEGSFFLCHGSPADESEYLLREVTDEGAALRTPEVLAKSVADVDQPVIFCGHDHCPALVTLPGGTLIVNPGSVGLPAYTDVTPHPHIVETGSPYARYAVVTRTGKGWMVEMVAVPYDWRAAAETAAKNGRPDWAGWLATGRAARETG